MVLPTLVVTHQLQVERRTGKVRRPETDVLPLCHATNYLSVAIIFVVELLLNIALQRHHIISRYKFSLVVLISIAI